MSGISFLFLLVKLISSNSYKQHVLTVGPTRKTRRPRRSRTRPQPRALRLPSGVLRRTSLKTPSSEPSTFRRGAHGHDPPLFLGHRQSGWTQKLPTSGGWSSWAPWCFAHPAPPQCHIRGTWGHLCPWELRNTHWAGHSPLKEPLLLAASPQRGPAPPAKLPVSPQPQ